MKSRLECPIDYNKPAILDSVNLCFPTIVNLPHSVSTEVFILVLVVGRFVGIFHAE